jgi:nicotinamidase-related amidase
MVYNIDPRKAALLVIDVQREYFDEGRPLYTPNAISILPNLIKLYSAAHAAGIPVVFVQHVHKADGSDVGRMGDFDPTPVFVEGTPGVEQISQLPVGTGDVVVKKTRYSAFVNTRLQSVLDSMKVDTLLIAGLMTNYCCVTTARHAHDLDYQTIFVSDANSGPDMPDLGFGPVSHAEVMKVVATSLAGGVADIVLTNDILQEISRK